MHQDAVAALQYAVSSHHTETDEEKRPMNVVIWGQSIGCAFASHLAAGMLEHPSLLTPYKQNVELETLILETPFTSASEMLKTLYPQKWLPYRYLSIFLWNRLDTVGALGRLKTALDGSGRSLSVVMLEGEKDELVPREHGDEIEKLCKNDGEAPRPKELVAGHHTTPEVMSCAPKLSATHLGPLKLISCSSLARQCRDQRSATQSSSVESLLPGRGSVTTVAGLGGLSF